MVFFKVGQFEAFGPALFVEVHQHALFGFGFAVVDVDAWGDGRLARGRVSGVEEWGEGDGL